LGAVHNLYAAKEGTMKKTPRKKLEKELDALWGKLAHQRVKKCQWPGCDKTERLNAHHFFHQAQGRIARWSLENAIILCYGHHMFQVHQKGDVEPIREVLIQTIGQSGFDMLKSEVRGSWKPTIQELEALKEKWEGMLSRQRSGRE